MPSTITAVAASIIMCFAVAAAQQPAPLPTTIPTDAAVDCDTTIDLDAPPPALGARFGMQIDIGTPPQPNRVITVFTDSTRQLVEVLSTLIYTNAGGKGEVYSMVALFPPTEHASGISSRHILGEDAAAARRPTSLAGSDIELLRKLGNWVHSRCRARHR